MGSNPTAVSWLCGNMKVLCACTAVAMLMKKAVYKSASFMRVYRGCHACSRTIISCMSRGCHEHDAAF